MKASSLVLLVSDSAGIYVPQQFAKQCREHCVNVSDEDWEILLTGPDHDDYWDAWDSVVDSAVLVSDKDPEERYKLSQDGDLWAIPEEWEWVDELNTYAPPESDTLRRYTLPSYWASYLVNGDDSGLTEGEAQAIDDFLGAEELRQWTCADVSGQSWFSRSCDAPSQPAGDRSLFTFVFVK